MHEYVYTYAHVYCTHASAHVHEPKNVLPVASIPSRIFFAEEHIVFLLDCESWSLVVFLATQKKFPVAPSSHATNKMDNSLYNWQ